MEQPIQLVSEILPEDISPVMDLLQPLGVISVSTNGIVTFGDGVTFDEVALRNMVLSISRVHELWEYGNKIALDAFDNNSRIWAVSQVINPQTPAWRLQRIAAIQVWLDNVWEQYYIAKAMIEAGDLNAWYPDMGSCPYKFSDLLTE